MTIRFERNFITEEEAADLLRIHRSCGNQQATICVTPKAARESIVEHPVVQRILKFIHDNYSDKATLSGSSQVYTQDKLDGHKVHDDKGKAYTHENYGKSPGHMEWCEHSASVLLNPATEFTGGKFFYDEAGAPDISPEDQYLSLAYHTSEVRHGVLPHEGERVMLLLFLGEG